MLSFRLTPFTFERGVEYDVEEVKHKAETQDRECDQDGDLNGIGEGRGQGESRRNPSEVGALAEEREAGVGQDERVEEEAMAAWMDATSKKRQRKMAELGGKIKELGDQLDRTVNQEERGEIL